jgi:hypothetical protein
VGNGVGVLHRDTSVLLSPSKKLWRRARSARSPVSDVTRLKPGPCRWPSLPAALAGRPPLPAALRLTCLFSSCSMASEFRVLDQLACDDGKGDGVSALNAETYLGRLVVLRSIS